MQLVEEQVALGPRVPGTGPHDALARRLGEALEAAGAELHVQRFPVRFRGGTLACRNIVGIFRAAGHRPAPRPPLLIGTHYDTRIRADRDPDPARREEAIPGANDGGSGTAIFLHMLPRLAAVDFDRDLAVAFLDAEDLGNIDGKDFALGAAYLAANPVPEFSPAEAVILDMVGGADMILDIEAGALRHEPSLRLMTSLFRPGIARGMRPFAGEKAHRVKEIISDQTPFAARGAAACLLIDIDYPQWHTHADLPEAMSGESLAAIEEALWPLLLPLPGSERRSSPGSSGP